MHVAVDARHLVAKSSGIGTYQENLIREMLAADEDLRLLLITRKEGVAARFTSERCTELVYDVQPRSLRTLYALGRKLRNQSFDLFHGSFNLLPAGIHQPTIVTIHDIMQIQDPSCIDLRKTTQYTVGLFYWRLAVAHAINSADRLLAVSEATRDNILRHFGHIPRSKIWTTPLGVDPYFLQPASQDELASVSEMVGSAEPFVLIVGNESPHKNHLRAIRAFMAATVHAPELRCVIVRRAVRPDPRLKELLGRPEVNSKVVVLGHVDQSQLRALYQMARSFFHPSWVEGFGLPILEAMASGCPVVTSDRSAPAEVAGDAALTVDPFEESAMTEALVHVHRDSTLREMLVRAGRDRAEQFTWSQTAARTLEAYCDLLANGPAVTN